MRYRMFYSIITLLFLNGCSNISDLDQARIYIQAGNYDLAFPLLIKDIDKNQENADVFFLLGKCYLNTETSNLVNGQTVTNIDFNTVGKYFDKSINLKPELKESIGKMYFDKFISLVNNGDFNNGFISAENSIKYSDNYKNEIGDEYYNYGKRLIENDKKIDYAENILDKSIEYNPILKDSIGKIYFDKFILLVNKGDLKNGFISAENSIKYSDEFKIEISKSYFNYGKNLIENVKNIDYAENILDKVIEYNPTLKDSVGSIYMKYALLKSQEELNWTGVDSILEIAYKGIKLNPKLSPSYVELKDKYSSVRVGLFEFTRENLNVSTFRNGDSILQIKSKDEYDRIKDKEVPAWCYYNFDPQNEHVYGKLYNKYVLSDKRGVGSLGYHIPTIQNIDMFLRGWRRKDDLGSVSGFRARAGGGLISDQFKDLDRSGYWWAIEKSDYFGEDEKILVFNYSKISKRVYKGVYGVLSNYPNNFYSVRLIKSY